MPFGQNKHADCVFLLDYYPLDEINFRSICNSITTDFGFLSGEFAFCFFKKRAIMQCQELRL